MPFNASKSGVKDARNELNQLEQWVSACNDRCSDVNTSFAAIMAGSWADAEVSAAIQLQTYLLIYTQALEQTHTTYDDMITELDGTLSTARDAVLESVKASTGDADKLHFDDTGAVTSGVSNSETALENLNTQVGVAEGALSGLENSGAIAAALDALTQATTKEAEDIEKVRTTYDEYQQAVDDFEDEFASRLSAQEFISQPMLDSAAKTMTDQFEGSAIAGIVGTIGSFKSNFISPVKDTVEMFAKPLAELKPENAVALWNSMKKVFTKGGLSHIRELGSSAKALLTNNEGIINIFKKGTFKSGNFKKVLTDCLGEWGKKFKADFRSWSRIINWTKNADDIDNAIDASRMVSKGDKFLKIGRVSSLDDAADLASTSGKILKGGAKYLGFVGDFIELGTGLMDASKAYQTTVGDGAQKTAAAVVTGGSALVKFGAGKAVGAAIGTCLGGPLGAVAGIALGGLVDAGLNWIGEQMNKSGATQSITNGIAEFLRGGKSDSAFAPA